MADEALGARALLIGIDQYPHISKEARLKGSVNDVELVAGVLVDVFGFAHHRVRKLVDGQASRHAILEALEKLIEETQPNDIVVVYFSGHGSQVQVRFENGDQEQVEGIVPFDFRSPTGRNQAILDFELRKRLKRLEPNAHHVVLILDTCFSGGGFRDSLSMIRFSDSRNLPPVEYRRVGAEISGFRDSFRSGWRPDSQILLAACGATESAAEICASDRYFGLFTTRVCLAFRQALDDMSYRDVMEQVFLAVVEQSGEQRPELKGPGELSLFGGLKIDRSPGVRVVSRHGGEIWMAAGAIEGATVGALYEIHRKSEGRKEKIGFCRIVSVKSSRSLAWILMEDPSRPIESGDVAYNQMGRQSQFVKHEPEEGLLRRVRETSQDRRKPGLNIRLERRTGAFHWEEPEPNRQGEFKFFNGDEMKVSVRNDFSEPLFINVLSLGLDQRSLYRIHTLLGLESPVPPGETLVVGAQEGLEIHLYFPWTGRRRSNGLESYFILAATRWLPWWFWCLSDQDRERENSVDLKHTEDRYLSATLHIRLMENGPAI